MSKSLNEEQIRAGLIPANWNRTKYYVEIDGKVFIGFFKNPLIPAAIYNVHRKLFKNSSAYVIRS